MDPVARRGPLVRGPGAERGTYPNLSTLLSQLRGFRRKTSKIRWGKIFIFGKKSHSAEKKLKGGTLWDFSGHGNKFERISPNFNLNGLSSNFPKTGISSNHCVRIWN